MARSSLSLAIRFWASSSSPMASLETSCSDLWDMRHSAEDISYHKLAKTKMCSSCIHPHIFACHHQAGTDLVQAGRDLNIVVISQALLWQMTYTSGIDGCPKRGRQ